MSKDLTRIWLPHRKYTETHLKSDSTQGHMKNGNKFFKVEFFSEYTFKIQFEIVKHENKI
jgi:hypothetical protein